MQKGSVCSKGYNLHCHHKTTFGVAVELREGELKKMKWDLKWQNIFTITTEVSFYLFIMKLDIWIIIYITLFLFILLCFWHTFQNQMKSNAKHESLSFTLGKSRIHHKVTQHTRLWIAFLTKNSIKQNLKRKSMPIPCTHDWIYSSSCIISERCSHYNTLKAITSRMSNRCHCKMPSFSMHLQCGDIWNQMLGDCSWHPHPQC